LTARWLGYTGPAIPTHFLHDLRGGARLTATELPDRASASLVLMFGVGSRFEEERIGGISHFLEHLLFKGTRRRPSSKAIAEAMEGVGGVINAWTDKEVTAYWARVPAERLELATDVLFDVVTESKLAPEDIERERMVILEELKMYLDQPQDYVSSLFEQIVWPDHPLGRDVIGTTESVAQMSRQDLKEYLNGHYGLPNLVVGLAGGIDSERARHLVEERLRLPEEIDRGSEEAGPRELDEPHVYLHRKDTEQAHICLGTRAFSYLDPDRHALDLLSTVLGEGMSSRLFLEIREKRGLAYDVHSYTSKHRDTGYFGVYLGVDPSKAEEAVHAVQAEIRHLLEEPVPESELIKAKEYTKGRLRLGLESTNSLASWQCHQQLLMGRIRTVDEVVDLIDSVTVEDLVRVGRHVLDAPVQLAVIGPFPSDTPFRTAVGA
jgi:predicted Zn-dependent peptidase